LEFYLTGDVGYNKEMDEKKEKKHSCEDCEFCQFCSDSRCSMCRCEVGQKKKKCVKADSMQCRLVEAK
jgi:hypothetical protein